MKKRHILIFAGPIVLILLIHFIRLVYTSFTDLSLTLPSYVGFENYIRLGGDSLFRAAIGNTLLLYTLNAAIVGTVSLLIHLVVRKYSKIAYNCCVFVFLFASIGLISVSLQMFSELYWILSDNIQSFWGMLLYFVIATLGIVLALLAIPFERRHKALRPILAFSLPIILTWILEGIVRRIVYVGTSETIAMVRAYRLIVIDIGHASAMSVINILIVVALIAIIIPIVLLTRRIFTKKAV